MAASSLRKMGVFFGLTEDDNYQDAYAESDGYGAREPATVTREESARPARRTEYARPAEQAGREWPAQPEPYTAEYTEYVDYAAAAETGSYRITTLHPRTYNEALAIGEHFRAGTPVIMNLSEMADTDAKRLVDFAAGLTFGLHGRVERVTSKVFLLSPQNVTVTAQDKARIAENGFFNQS